MKLVQDEVYHKPWDQSHEHVWTADNDKPRIEVIKEVLNPIWLSVYNQITNKISNRRH